MKTAVVILEGHEFIVSATAMPILTTYVKSLRKSTLFKRRAYHDNLEALRDVLIEQGSKRVVSKPALTRAITLVGVPDQRSAEEKVKYRFPRTHTARKRSTSKTRRAFLFVKSHWLKSLAVALSIIALFMSTGYVFSGVMIFQSLQEAPANTWQTIDTTLGMVRSYFDSTITAPSSNWLFSWQIQILSAVLFFIVAMLLLRLRNPRHRLAFSLTTLACLFLLAIIWQVQQGSMANTIAFQSQQSSNAQPLEPRLAYLQQCGDEIQYVFDNRTAGMLFHQLRDDGFTLAASLPTKYGHPDLKQLCIEYNRLRSNHPATSIVLQSYAIDNNETLRPSDFHDTTNNTWIYGFFVK